MIPKPEFADGKKVMEWLEGNNVSGIILKGDGRHFSAGADLRYFNETNLSQEEYTNEFNRGNAILNYIENLEKPVIAAIDGACLGGGLEFALACHIRYCSCNAVFGFPEINHGILPGFGGTERLVKTVGRSRAIEILLTGDTFGAERALEIGLVNYISSEKSCFNYAVEVMEKIIAKGEKPVTYAIRSVNNSCRLDFETAMKEEGRMFADLVINRYGGEA